MTGPLRTLPVRDQIDAVSRHVGHLVEIRLSTGEPLGGILVAVAQTVGDGEWVAVLSPRVGSKVGSAVPLSTVSTIMREVA